ncbi:MAG: hypothetical protein M2R45_00777 [Verrucomicrobia subdivision 3 bacterium]|nr:hypothetical protein [Limisphaerales bacterium]
MAAKRILRRTRCERSFSSNSSPRSYALGRGFPFGLYKQIFPFERPEMRTAKRPSVMGGYTNGIVCERLAPGVRKELREKNLSSSKRPAQAQASSLLHAGRGASQAQGKACRRHCPDESRWLTENSFRHPLGRPYSKPTETPRPSFLDLEDCPRPPTLMNNQNSQLLKIPKLKVMDRRICHRGSSDGD